MGRATLFALGEWIVTTWGYDSRHLTHQSKEETEDLDRIIYHMQKYGINALIPIGGDDTLGVALFLHQKGFHVIGVPKTIDNDIKGTDFTFGFNTAVQTVTEALDKLQTTAESHHRILVVEVMGRHAGWIATYSGIAGGADEILIPEIPFDIVEVAEKLKNRHKRRRFSLVVVAEGAMPKEGEYTLMSDKRDSFGHVQLGGVGQWVADEIESRTGCETRFTNLGHIQRGGIPRLTTGSSRLGSELPPSMPSRRVSGARWLLSVRKISYWFLWKMRFWRIRLSTQNITKSLVYSFN